MKVVNQHNQQLIDRCKSGDKAAQFKIYKLYYKAMYNTALRILNDGYEAEDVMQDSFLAAFTKLNSYSETVTFGAWLKRIVINNSISALNKKNRIDEIPFEKVEFNETETVEIIDYNNLKCKEILNKMALLKTNYKVAITLHLIEGYDYEEIAQIMNISYENSRTTISRAKSKLRKLLAK